MTYDANIEKEAIENHFLAILRPAIKLEYSDFDVLDSARRTHPFRVGKALTLEDFGYGGFGADRAQASDATLSDGYWYYDANAGLLYISQTQFLAAYDDDQSLLDKQSFRVQFEVYYSTSGVYYHEDPSDANSDEVYFEPFIVTAPQIQSQNSDLLSGFLPTAATSMTLSTVSGDLQEMIHAVTFHRADVEIWHYLGELEAANLKKIFSGKSGDVDYNDQTMSITLFDRNTDLEDEFRNYRSGGNSYWPNLPTVEPDFRGAPIRMVFGLVDSFRLVNIDYNADVPATSNNRIWGAHMSTGVSATRTTTVSATPASGTQTTYINDPSIVRPRQTTQTEGRPTVLLGTGGGADLVEVINTVDNTTPYRIIHTTIGTPRTPGETVTRYDINRVTLVQGGNEYILKPVRDFSISETSGYWRIVLTSSAESNVGASTINPGEDFIFARIYGPTKASTDLFPQIGGSPYARDSGIDYLRSNYRHSYGVSNGIVLLYSILRTYAGIPESEIDTATFLSEYDDEDVELGFTVPAKIGDDHPKLRELIRDLCRDLFLRIFVDSDGKWTFRRIGPMGTADKVLADDEIVGKPQFNYDFQDIASDFFIKIGRGDIERGSLAVSENSFLEGENDFQRTSIYFHRISKQVTVKTRHINFIEKSLYVVRYALYFSDRKGFLRLSVKRSLWNTNIGDILEINRARLTGFPYDADTERTRKYVVVAITKTLGGVTVILEDQKAIEDNIDRWNGSF